MLDVAQYLFVGLRQNKLSPVIIDACGARITLEYYEADYLVGYVGNIKTNR